MLNKAILLAATSKDIGKNFLLGCIALREDGVLVESTNTTTSENPTPSAHAEARALRKAGFGSTLWVARVLKDKKTWAMARPCATCRSRIINKGVTKVFYTIGPGEYGIWIPGNKDVLEHDKTRIICK